MGGPYAFTNFPSGAISERLVEAVSVLPVAQFSQLIQEGKVVLEWKNQHLAQQQLAYRHLRWDCISDYAKACDLSLSEIIYGENKPQNTCYSAFDAVVIPLLNALDPDVLRVAGDIVRTVYVNPLLQIPASHTPSAKLFSIITSAGRLPANVPEGEQDRYSMDINPILEGFRGAKKKERYIFHIDRIADMCVYCQVSPHWALSLTGPLLCRTAEADAFFDLFCLYHRSVQIPLICMLLALCERAEEVLPAGTLEQIQAIIAAGGEPL